MKKHWLILAGLILSTSILTFGNAAYQQTSANFLLPLDFIQDKQVDTNIESKKETVQTQLVTNRRFISEEENNNEETRNSQKQTNADSDQSINNLQFTLSNPQPTISESNSAPQSTTPSSQLPNSSPTQTQSQEIKLEQKIANLSIEGVGDYQVDWQENDTAWTIMLRAAAKYHFVMSYQKFAIGIYISRLGDKDTQGTYYWSLYYNNAYSMLGVSDLKIQPNDKISWKYESWM